MVPVGPIRERFAQQAAECVAHAGDTARVRAIDAILPQTQCGQCGYVGCLPYARALAQGTAAINRCPPGGAAGIAALAALLATPPLALDPACGPSLPLQHAVIDEARCIGCTICIRACPVDAILGAANWMHTVIDDGCTGCALCVAPCPVDCIRMEAVDPPRSWTRADAQRARADLHACILRRRGRTGAAEAVPDALDPARQAELVATALHRARARRSERP